MVKVIDVFAGPGGLNEGFSQHRDQNGKPVFEVAGSFEMDAMAVETLRFRAAARKVGLTKDPQYLAYLNDELSLEALIGGDEFGAALKDAASHVHKLRLGKESRDDSDALIRAGLEKDEPWVLIGGPPCQAYSLVGRSKMGKRKDFLDDERHFLFEEYLHIIKVHKPTVFVMENVKGLLSATHRETRMFERILTDLQCEGEYEIRSLVVPDGDLKPRDFVIRSESYGIPQKRHRVILLGVRVDAKLGVHQPLSEKALVPLKDAIGKDLPALRSRVSRGDSVDAWSDAREHATELAAKSLGPIAKEGLDLPRSCPELYSGPAEYTAVAPSTNELLGWLRAPELEKVRLHEPRAHMLKDLQRYAYLAHMAAHGLHPRITDMPRELWPNHKNIDGENTPFVDRFKAQSWDLPSSTIVSHISKDGNYFIHPDPAQMRSLTVREAARLQTFPDDYIFRGNRTQQYHQVGNAVPPLLANQIAARIAALLGL